MLQEFIHWIAHTSASKVIANADWVIPAFQCVHILAIAVVVSTMGMMDLRLMGLIGRRYSLRSTVDRYLPWMWVAVLVLLVTGAVLITGEPERSLGNWVFQVKMGLLASVLLVTLGFKQMLKQHLDTWDRAGTRRQGSATYAGAAATAVPAGAGYPGTVSAMAVGAPPGQPGSSFATSESQGIQHFDVPFAARVTGFVSVLLWIGIVVCGRWIAYVS